MGFLVVRTIILYVSVIVAMRLMGKRTIGEMHPTELVVSIMISDLAAVPMQSESTPLTYGLVPIFTLVVLEIIFAFLLLKSQVVRKVLVGRSGRVVKNGKLMEKDMRRLRISVDDVEEQIRINGYTSLSEILEVVVETNGQVSVIPKENNEAVPYLIISDGKIRKKNAQRAGFTMKNIEKELEKRGVSNVKEVLYMSGLNSKVIHLQTRG